MKCLDQLHGHEGFHALSHISTRKKSTGRRSEDSIKKLLCARWRASKILFLALLLLLVSVSVSMEQEFEPAPCTPPMPMPLSPIQTSDLLVLTAMAPCTPERKPWMCSHFGCEMTCFDSCCMCRIGFCAMHLWYHCRQCHQWTTLIGRMSDVSKDC